MVDATRAGTLVEVVYILGAEVEVFRVGFCELLLDFREGEVGGVGLGGAGVSTTLGVEAPDEGRVGVPCFGGGDVFDSMAVPEASRAAECGEAAFGGDSGAGEDEQAVAGGELHVNETRKVGLRYEISDELRGRSCWALRSSGGCVGGIHFN